ncbi:MAG: pyridoxal phosphate-dependent aminotransferase [Nitrososphaerales archaeon]
MLQPQLVGASPHTYKYSDTIFVGGSEPWAWKSAEEYVPKQVRDAVKMAVDGKYMHCADSRGLPEFKEAISRKVKEFNGIDADPADEILVSPGSGHALHLAGMTFLDSGDEILTTDPTFSFSMWDANLTHARVRFIETRAANGWRVTPEQIEEKVTPKTKLLWLTDPDNPTGRLFTKKEVEGIAQIAKDKDLVVVVDQNFERVTYDGRTHTSFASIEGMKERTVTIWSMSKEYALCGLRIGYTVAHKDVIERMRVLQVQNGSSGASPIFQVAGKVALECYTDEIWHEWLAYWQKGRDLAVPLINSIKGVSTWNPEGGYALYMDTSKFGKSLEVCAYLAEKAHVITSPGMWFGPVVGDAGLRIVFGCVEHEKLVVALNRVKVALEQHPSSL